MEPSQWGPAWVLSAVYFPAVPFEEKKKMYYCLTALVNVTPFSPVWEDSQPQWWPRKDSSSGTAGGQTLVRKRDGCANNTARDRL